MDPQLLIVFAILGGTVGLIITEVFRIDVVAVLAMLTLAWAGSITPQEARSGFSSNAVLAIIAVMIMGRGLYKSGVTEKLRVSSSRWPEAGVAASSPRSP